MQKADFTRLVRANILRLQRYSPARTATIDEAAIFMDANENPFDTGFNRYPDPLQGALKDKIAEIKSCPAEKIFLGNGSTEIIDLLIRIFCEPGEDHIITLPPTCEAYRFCADISNVGVMEVPLNAAFQPQVERIIAQSNLHSKLLFVCSPNNPTGNNISLESIRKLLIHFPGIVVLDEAYIDFSDQESGLGLLEEFENLVILQSFSKAWGLAGVRLGMAFAGEAIIELLNKVKAPYNVNLLTQDTVYMALDEIAEKEEWVRDILSERESLTEELQKLKCVRFIYPSDANFLLVKVTDSFEIHQHLINNGIIIRNQSSVELCDSCLRFTVGSSTENEFLVEALYDYDLSVS